MSFDYREIYNRVADVPFIAVLGYGMSLMNLAIYKHVDYEPYAGQLTVQVLKTSAAWAWATFFINSSLTLAILVKIM